MRHDEEHDNYLDKRRSWAIVQEWLLSASSVVEVTCDLGRYDSCLMYCGHADEYIGNLSDLRGGHFAQLTIFLYTWISLEALLDLLLPDYGKSKPFGKISSACLYLKDNFDPHPHPRLYDAFLNQIKKFSNKNHYSNLPKHISTSGLGLYLAYKLRNDFAHGALILPEQDSNTVNAAGNFSDMVESACRLTLLSMQMLIYPENSENDIHISMLAYLNDDDSFHFGNALLSLHYQC